MSLWKKLRYRLETLGLQMLVAGVRRLPRHSCVTLAQLVGALAYYADARGRAVALANLEAAFGDEMPAARRREIARRSYQNFARNMFDLFWTPRLVKEGAARWIVAEVGDAVRQAAAGRGVVLLGAHFAHWEWGSLGMGLAGFAPLAVAEDFKNGALTEIFASLRQATGVRILQQESSMLRLLKTVKRGGAGAFLCDLSFRPSGASSVIRVLGLETCVTNLHAVLAQRGGARVLIGYGDPQPDGRCRFVLRSLEEVPGESLESLVQRCWDQFEVLVRARPELYFWPYKHFRYRPRDAARAYPFYANESGAFEKLRRQQAVRTAQTGEVDEE